MADKKKVLVVEDEVDLRMLLREALEKAGYEVCEAGDGQQALDLAASQNPDLILSDVLMPKMDGNAFYKELRKSKFGKTIPFIILTARTKMQDYFEFMKVDGFVSKPFQFPELLAQVEDVLKKQEKKARPVSAPPQGRDQKSGASAKDILSGGMEAVVDDRAIARSAPDNEDEGGPVAPVKFWDRERLQKSAQTKHGRVLLAEDDRAVAAELGKEFLKRGLSVEFVQSAEACLEVLYDYQPHVVVMNYVVSDTNAMELAQKIKANPSFSKLPIVVYQNPFVRNADGDLKGGQLSVEGKQLLQKIYELLG